ncbi:MAG: Holliday junction branch migration protein RuvA [Alphaproteobacteria bacterium]|nr:Holliday junction branch migration protein RuvA [Rickettsiales bacterium]
MIGFLKGTIEEVESDKILIDVNGVGYVVFCNEKDKNKLPQEGIVKLLIHPITKEDGTSLYGFIDKVRREIFAELIKISGVSGKVATTILSFCATEDLQMAVFAKEENFLTVVPGIGKKLANRIINECKLERISSHISLLEKTPLLHDAVLSTDTEAKSRLSISIQAVSGLVNIGIQRDIAQKCVMEVIKDNQKAKLETIIKLSVSKIYSKK